MSDRADRAIADEHWRTGNFAHMDVAILRVRRRLEHAYFQRQRMTGSIAAQEAAVPEPPTPAPGSRPYALDFLTQMFRLTPFETELLTLAVAVEVSADVAHLCRELQQHPERGLVSAGLAMAVLPGGDWNSLRPDAPLRAYDLVELVGDERSTGLAMRPVIAPEAVVHFLLGSKAIDPRLGDLLTQVPPSPLWNGQARAAVQAARLLDVPTPPVVHLGADFALAEAAAAAAAGMLDRRLYSLAADALPTDAHAQDQFRRRWNRDFRLVDGVLLLKIEDPAPGQAAAIVRLCRRLEGPVLLAGDLPPAAANLGDRSMIRLDLPAPAVTEMAEAWRGVLAPLGAESLAPRLADQFRLSPAMMHSVAGAAMDVGEGADGADLEVGDRIWSLCRLQGRHALSGLAQRMEGKASLDDLVLPQNALDVLHQVISRHANRDKVLRGWGLERKSRGLGLSVLFAGASGTGKTMAAEVVANALDLDLFRIDLASVVDKYVGETEKNLRRVFDAAERSGCVLLFDEADALFGKRSDVKDSHDRHANLEVGYLLQRIESYPGIAILTTNLPDAIDPAFLRRFALVAHFPFPGESQRHAMWDKVFPAATEIGDLDRRRLARLPLSGGQIVSVALNAAFAAAEDGEAVADRHMDVAVRLEFAKQDRTPPLLPLPETTA